ncbi:MAG: cell division FtsA domain-containing protein [bacterium]|nr:cell division FtsA domain-containing protein [bacterium]MDZ4247964.1 cell division FtsA domain-containing protein [Patescibacteria group bacterium]
MGILDKVGSVFAGSAGQTLANYFIALDIGTEFVKVLICEIVDGKAVVIGSGRQRQRLGDMQGGAVTDIGGVIENCEKALERAHQTAGVMPEQVVMGIAGELVKGATTTVHYERAKPDTKIDLTELKNIVHKVQWKAFDQVRQQLAWETGHSEIDVKLVNAAIVDVRIDGYGVTNPVGFQGKDVTIGIFNAFAPLVHLTALQAIPEELGLDLLSIAAEPYAVARCLGIEDSSEFSAIFIDIGGGTTDVAVVNNGGVVGTKMFALGGRTFTRRLAQSLHAPFDKAEETKLAYTSRLLDQPSTKLVKDAVAADADVWLSGVQLTLSEFGNLDLLPSRILLCGGGSELPEISKVLGGAKWYKQLPFAKKPTVSFISPEDIPNVKDQTRSLVGPQDVTPMALANLALDLAGPEELLPSILRRAVKAMTT